MPQMTPETRKVLAEFLKNDDSDTKLYDGLEPDKELYGLQIAEATGLGRGTAYPILERLEEDGLLTSWREVRKGQPGYRPRRGGGPPRRYYRLTSEGWAVARQEAALTRSQR